MCWTLGIGCSTEDADLHTRASALEIDDAASAARSRAANFEAMRGRMKPAAQIELGELSARIPEDLIVYSSTTSASQALGTGGGDLLPLTCRGSVISTPPDYEAAAHCFFAAYPSLMLDGPDSERGSDPELVVVRNEVGDRNDATEQYLQLDQSHRGYPVEARSIVLVFIDRRLVTVSGRYAGTARFDAPSVDLARLETQARAVSEHAVTTLGLRYNPASGELEFAFHDGRLEHRLNAADGDLRATKPISHALEVNKNINVYQFPSSVYLGTSNTTSLVSSAVSCSNGSPGTCDIGGSGTCRYSPRQSGIADRVNSLHVTYNTTPPNETPIYEDDPCGSTSVFTQSPWTSQYYLEHYAASARRNLDEVADIMQHSESFFWVYPRTPFSVLRLNINAWTGFTYGGLYTPNVYGAAGTKINLKQQPMPRAIASKLV